MPPVPAPAQAILFVPPASCLSLSADLKDMSQMILRTKGPDRLPAGYEIVLYISMSDSDKVGVFYVESECPQPGPAAVPRPVSAHRATPRGPAHPLRLPRHPCPFAVRSLLVQVPLGNGPGGHRDPR